MRCGRSFRRADVWSRRSKAQSEVADALRVKAGKQAVPPPATNCAGLPNGLRYRQR